MHIVTELVERRVHDDVAKANGQRVEALRDSRIPDLRVQDLAPVGLDEIPNAIDRARQGYRTHQQYAHDDIRKQGEKIGSLARALDAAPYDQKNAQPGD